jgi:hypothetical protein
MARRDVLGHRLLAASTADAATVDNVALLGLVTQTTGLIGTRRTAGTVDDLQLAKLLMHSQQCSTSNINWESSSRGCKFIPPSTATIISNVLKSSEEFDNIRERASRSASYLTASSSEVPRHLRRISTEARDRRV